MEIACVRKLRADSVRGTSERLLPVGTAFVCSELSEDITTKCNCLYTSVKLTVVVSENGLKKEELLCLETAA
jgi:hypothetical protein